MCFLKQTGQTIEEIVARHSVGMTPEQKGEYWYELDQTLFNLLGKIDIPLIGGITNQKWAEVAQAQYPTLTDIKIPDSQYQTTTLMGLQQILSLEWTNQIPYVADLFDCDKFANTLYDHLCQYYKLNAIFPVWGMTTSGYHGFNCAVVQNGNDLIARLIEPQTDTIFIDTGPLGKYIPRRTAEFLAIMPINSPALQLKRR